MECLSLAAQMDLGMIFDPSEARAVQGVFVFPRKTHPTGGLAIFPQELSVLH